MVVVSRQVLASITALALTSFPLLLLPVETTVFIGFTGICWTWGLISSTQHCHRFYSTSSASAVSHWLWYLHCLLMCCHGKHLWVWHRLWRSCFSVWATTFFWLLFIFIIIAIIYFFDIEVVVVIITVFGDEESHRLDEAVYWNYSTCIILWHPHNVFCISRSFEARLIPNPLCVLSWVDQVHGIIHDLDWEFSLLSSSYHAKRIHWTLLVLLFCHQYFYRTSKDFLKLALEADPVVFPVFIAVTQLDVIFRPVVTFSSSEAEF